MKSNPIRLFPDPILRRKADLVRVFDKELDMILRVMDKEMRSQPHGIGIAAPQIGISKSIAIVDVSSRIVGAIKLILINPEIISKKEEWASREGCMSLPDYTAHIKRYHWIEVKWQDENGKRHMKEAAGIEAICIQHEIDHLNGILYIDHVVSLKRDMMPRPRKGR